MVYRPPLVKQLDGSNYAGLNCTMAAGCMAIIRDKRGKNPKVEGSPWYPTPSFLRRKSGDTSGGTRLPQVDYVATHYYETNLEVILGDMWPEFRHRIATGQGAIVQGYYNVFSGTRFDAAPGFHGNHAIYVNEIRWSDKYDRWEYLMYDPMADGRRRGIYTGPKWIEESTLQLFCGRLIVNNQGSRLGVGRVYVAYTHDTQGTQLKYGATIMAAKVFKQKKSGVRVRRKPVIGSYVAYRLKTGDTFTAYQKKTDGPLVDGSRVWYGDRDGIKWVPGVRFIGG